VVLKSFKIGLLCSLYKQFECIHSCTLWKSECVTCKPGLHSFPGLSAVLLVARNQGSFFVDVAFCVGLSF